MRRQTRTPAGAPAPAIARAIAQANQRAAARQHQHTADMAAPRNQAPSDAWGAEAARIAARTS